MSEVIKAFPLQWPVGWKRTEAMRRRAGQFGKTKFVTGSQPGTGWNTKASLSVMDAVDRIRTELGRMGVRDADLVISTNLRLRLDGLPRSDQPRLEDPGAAVYWLDPVSGAKRCMAIDQYTIVEHNLAAVAATLEAMRAIERHGGAEILDRAFTGFTALPAPMAAQRPWRDVLGVQGIDQAAYPVDVVKAAYQRERSKAHPDRAGGSHDAFLAVQSAYEAAGRELGFRP